ncbi:hypothetical protein SESBI_12657 [Sesbania bispinosa]|nr:hypothetical protein SESBI_12657 [Sesbania bispinosa]
MLCPMWYNSTNGAPEGLLQEHGSGWDHVLTKEPHVLHLLPYVFTRDANLNQQAGSFITVLYASISSRLASY